MALPGNSDDTNGYHTIIKNGEAHNADMVKAVLPPLGAIFFWVDMDETPELPDGFAVCDGSIVTLLFVVIILLSPIPLMLT